MPSYVCCPHSDNGVSLIDQNEAFKHKLSTTLPACTRDLIWCCFYYIGDEHRRLRRAQTRQGFFQALGPMLLPAEGQEAPENCRSPLLHALQQLKSALHSAIHRHHIIKKMLKKCVPPLGSVHCGIGPLELTSSQRYRPVAARFQRS